MKALLFFVCMLPSLAFAGWTEQVAGNQDLFSVWGPSPEEVYAVGAGGTIAHSIDKGRTWRIEKSNTQEPLYAVWGTGSNNVYIAGDNGTLLRSQDQGKSWAPLGTPQLVPLRGIWGTGSDLYIAGEQGVILFSNDGMNLQALNSGVKTSLFAVGGLGADNVFAIGEQGTIIRSRDKGKTWVALKSNTTEALRSLWVSPSGELYIAGYHTTILRSRDKGDTWETLQTGGTEWLAGVWGLSSSEIFAVGAKGAIFQTSNGGKTWERLANQNSSALYSVWGATAESLRFVGRGGLVLRRALPDPVLTVTSEPTGAELFVDGSSFGAAPSQVTLKPGKHLLEIKLADYNTYSAWVELEEGQNATHAASLALTPTVTIAIGVQGAEVFLDGKPQGRSPIQLKKVPWGEHTVVLKKPGFQDWVNTTTFDSDTLTLAPEMNPIPIIKEEDLSWVSRPTNLRYLSFGAAGAAAVGIGLGAREAFLWRQPLEVQLDPNDSPTVQDQKISAALRNQSQHRTRALVAGGIADAMLITSGFLFYNAKKQQDYLKKEKTKLLGVAVSQSGVSVQGRF